MAFEKSFDTLLAGILTDYQNQFPEADISQGTLLFMKSACLASAMWGIYQHQEFIGKQIFPDTATTENLEHHAWLRGLTRVDGESDSELLARLLTIIRRPPAGGNKYDYVNWAMTIDNVAAAYCYPLADGDGTVSLVVVADSSTGSEVPSQALLDEVEAYINDVRPVTHSQFTVLGPTITTQAVTMTVTGTTNYTEIAADIEALLSAMEPDQVLYRVQLSSIAVQLGATNVTITTPAADVTPAEYHMIRPGVISVT